MKELVKNFSKGAQIWFWTLSVIAVAWGGVSFATSAWGALPNAGTTLSSAAWNDIVSQLNTLAGAITVNGGNVGIGISGVPTDKLDVNGNFRATNVYVWTSATAINDLLFARPELPHSYVATVCPSPSRPIFVHMKSIWKTGSQLCALDGASDGARTTCNSVKYVMLKTDGSRGTWTAWDMACSAAIDYPWPWANWGGNNSRPDEWISGSKVVCCQ